MGRKTVLVVLLLLGGATQAAASTTLIAGTVETQGATIMAGEAAAWITSDPRSGTDGISLGSFQLEASKLRLEVDWEEFAVRIAQTVPTLETSDTDISRHSNAVVASTTARASSFAFLMPSSKAPPRFIWDGSDGNIVGTTQDEVENYARVVDERPPVVAALRGSAAATSKDSYTLTVTGDFLLSIWDIDFNIHSENGAADVWTGERSGDVGPAPGTEAVDSERRQQAYLFVEDGVLQFQVKRAAGSVLYAVPEQLESEGDMHLRAATGTVQTRSGPRDLLGEDIRLRGPASLDLGRPTSQGLPARITDGDTAWIGDEPVAMAYAHAPTGSPLWPWLLAGALALAAVAWLRPLWSLRHAQGLGVEPPEPPRGIRDRRAAGHWLLAFRACNGTGASRPRLVLGIYHAWRAHRIGRRPLYTMGYAETLRMARRWRTLARIAPPLVDALMDQRERATVALWLQEACDRLGRCDQAEAWRQRAMDLHRYAARAFLGLPKQAPQTDVAFT
jgi:hypothetical protein